MATPSASWELRDRGVTRQIEVIGGIIGTDPRQKRIGPNLVARWQSSMMQPEGIGAGELALEFHGGGAAAEQWDVTEDGKSALLATRDPRGIRAYGELLLELATLVEELDR